VLCLLAWAVSAITTPPAHARANGQAAQAVNGELATCNGNGQAVIAGALTEVRAMRGGTTLLAGWGEEVGLARVPQVLARTAQLIQTKG